MGRKTIIISRTDGIGDVILSLPVAGVLKKLYPDCKIIFLGKTYTQQIIKTCKYVDEFVDWDKLKQKENYIETIKNLKADILIHVFPNKNIARAAKRAKIPIRLGTTNRLYHWNTCNKLVRLSRKNSPYHEAQLNLKLITPLGAKKLYNLNEIPDYYGFTNIKSLTQEFEKILSKNKLNLILHPKTKGSAQEWGIANFAKLIEILPYNKFKIFITGTYKESEIIKEFLIKKHPYITDLTGKLTTEELISFISCADVIVAASTGPLHIAAALDKYAIGLYSPVKPIFPVRWAPLGHNASFIVENKSYFKHKKINKYGQIKNIKPELVKDKLMSLKIKKSNFV